MKQVVAGLVGGILFGFGLALSGMTDTNRVLGFLDVAGDWQPALLLVMLSAVLVTVCGFALVRRRSEPLFGERFHLPTRTAIDAQLLGGAALFGAGWGIYGYCPGPALTALIYLQRDTVIFVAAMLVGMWLASRLQGD